MTWEEARAVYRRLGEYTRSAKGRRPALTDLRIESPRVTRLSRAVLVYEGKAEPRTFSERLEARGVNGEAFTNESKLFRSHGVPGSLQNDLARYLQRAQRQVETRGRVSARTRTALQQIFEALAEDYDIDPGAYFAAVRRVYKKGKK